ncbi:hypothetical protein DWF00_00140 [Bosea caraganae]|uniref:DUF2157 domain-containing protein n=1 Tax=Bosea caraganae TaxID=2763117 RepID=A0A370L8A7_9HYPH|nr:hypothetical protein [Bosea caraganae]RDJ26633.1 hypothetical protein DWE98_07155 [Bosea caraganae]RDJ30519.1 hypothetical protein DWF00_00140 [Bosea caraganae]
MREDDLDAAVAEGIIDRAQAIRLRHLADTRRIAEKASGAALPPTFAAEDSRPVDPDDERFRLIGGFNDVFVTIGVCLLAGALLGLARVLGLDEAFALVGLIVAWGLAEWFSRRMRLALPSIALAVMFAGSAGLLAGIGVDAAVRRGLITRSSGEDWTFVAIGIAVMLASRLHRWRFGVPINSAITAAGGIATIIGLLLVAAPDLVRNHLNWIAFIAGLIVFAVAMRADMGDPRRLTRRSDSAFWLHLLAAPLIVHPVIQLATGGLGQLSTLQALIILVLFVLLGLIALVIDRRALLVSGLSYAGIAIAYLVAQKVSDGLGLPLALLGLAIVVLGLSAGWRSLRAWLVPLLPLGRLTDNLPPIALPDAR